MGEEQATAQHNWYLISVPTPLLIRAFAANGFLLILKAPKRSLNAPHEKEFVVPRAKLLFLPQRKQRLTAQTNLILETSGRFLLSQPDSTAEARWKIGSPRFFRPPHFQAAFGVPVRGKERQRASACGRFMNRPYTPSSSSSLLLTNFPKKCRKIPSLCKRIRTDLSPIGRKENQAERFRKSIPKNAVAMGKFVWYNTFRTKKYADFWTAFFVSLGIFLGISCE